MADAKITALAALGGASIDTAADALAIVDNSAGATKKTFPDDLRIAFTATQAIMEAATNTSTFPLASTVINHPGVAKAQGFITTPTTVTVSYPSAGVSVVKNGTGDYTVTHGRTFSSANYVPLVTPFSSGFDNITHWVTAKTATTFQVRFGSTAVVGTGDPVDPAGFFYVIFGDL